MSAIPDKYIRAAIIIAVKAQLSANYATCSIYDGEVPKDINPIPPLRIILGTQTAIQQNTTKCGHDWQSTITLDVINEQNQGFSDRSVVEDILQLINNAIDISPADLNIIPYVVYNTQYLNSTDMSIETPTKTINRKVVRYQFILGGVG